MGASSISGVRVAGIASAAPTTVLENRSLADRYGKDEIEKIIKATGVEKRRVAPNGMCTSDLCFAAIERLLVDLNWAKDSIDALIFVSQSGDYLLPATACLLQDRLKLPRRVAAMDLNLGCSGYPYGLWVASGLVASGAVKRVLLAVGEIGTRRVNPEDRSAAFLFGDVGTVTALEADKAAPALHFVLGTDGSGAEHLIIPAGGCRLLPSEKTLAKQTTAEGFTRSLGDVAMNGNEVFLFTIKEVPPLIREVMSAPGWTVEDIDAVIFHQANEFMLNHLAKKVKLPPAKMPLTIREFGNTSSATIPLTLSEALGARLREGKQKLVMAGFGVGLSWGAVAGELGPMVVPPLVEVPPEAMQKPILAGLAL